jgi:hypothetical protein
MDLRQHDPVISLRKELALARRKGYRPHPVLMVTLAAVVLLIVGLVLSQILRDYEAETSFMANTLVIPGSNPDSLEVNGKITKLDPVRGDLVMRLSFVPKGRLLAPDEVAPAETLVLDANSVEGEAQQFYPAGVTMDPLDITLNVDGTASNYPFDRHAAQLVLDLGQPLSEKEGPPVRGELLEYTPVPIALNLTAVQPGYRIALQQVGPFEDGIVRVKLTVRRSLTVISVTMFVMIVEWLLALGTLAVTLVVAIRGRRPDVAIFAWLATMLFALPPLRDVMPGVPPIGTLGDFLSFFWAVGIVAVCLIILVVDWVLRAPG